MTILSMIVKELSRNGNVHEIARVLLPCLIWGSNIVEIVMAPTYWFTPMEWLTKSGIWSNLCLKLENDEH